MPTDNSGVLSKIDQSTVIHAAIIVVVALIVYHIFFHR